MSGERELRNAYASILGQHFEEAAEWFRKALEQDPDNADYHYKLSITYARSGKVDEALHHAAAALRAQPDRAEYDLHLRTLQARKLRLRAERLLERDEDVPLAIVWLMEAARLDPLAEGVYLLLAAAHAGRNEYKEAISALRNLLELHPGHETAHALMEQYKAQFAAYLEEKS